MKKILVLFLLLLSTILNAQQWKWYLTSITGQPWGSNSNITAMNTAFGAAWSQGSFQGTPVNAVFAPSVCLVYLDGGSMNATAMDTYIQANQALIQSWVFNGGRLFFNAAPNQGGNQNWWFGGITLNYNWGPYSAPGYAATSPAHPIYAGPAVVTTTMHTGNWYCHGYVTGPGLTPIIINTVQPWNGGNPPNPCIILASKPWGAGMCLFGSMTNTSWHTPNPSATNLRANMLSWLYVCCTQPTINIAATSSVLCSGQTTTLTASGAGGGGTYTWSPGNVINATLAVTPTVTTIYTVVGTNSANCTNSQTFQIFVNPTPTVNPIASPSLVCKNSPVTFSISPAAGNPVTYSWTGPNGFTSPFQNPQIAAAQPSNTGIYTINVVSTFSNGTCSNSNTVALNVINTNTISSNNPTVCLGSNINLTSTVTGANAILWQGPNVYTNNIQNPTITNATPANAGIYTVTASFTIPGNTLICTSTSTSNVSVIVTSPVTVNIPANVCQNTTVNLTANALNTPTYNWTGPNFTSNQQNNTLNNIQPNQTGLYSVNAIWSLGAVSCTVGNSGMMNVVGVNTVSVNTPIQVCYPSNVQLTSNASGATSYSWTASNGLSFNQQNLLFTSPTPTLNGTYTVTAAFSNGVLTCYNSNTTQVTVNPILTFTLPPYKLMCYNETYTVNGPVGATSYTWSGPNQFISNQQNLYIPSIQTAMSGMYTLEINLGPCKTATTTSVEVLSPITFTTLPTNKIICKGDSTTLKVGASGGSGNYAYYWSPQQYLSSPTGSIQYVTPQGTTYYSIIAYDISCPNNTIATQVGVIIEELPSPQLNFPIASCEPLCLNLDTKFPNEVKSITYNFNNIKAYPNTKICLNEGIYNLTIDMIGKNGCTTTKQYQNNPIKVYPNPNGDFTYDPTNPNNISNNKVTFYPSAIKGSKLNFDWYFYGGKEINESTKNPTRAYDEPGEYPVVLITRNEWGCLDTTLKTIKIEEDYSIYIPNAFTPNNTGTNDQFFPVIYGAKEYTMFIYDRWGELILTTKNGKWDGTYKGLLCQDGVYVYKIIVTKPKGEGKKEYVGHVTLLK